jgi:hypothetical protein
MKRQTVLKSAILIVVFIMLASAPGAIADERPAPPAQSGSSATITYQGYLEDNGLPANGTFAMTFTCTTIRLQELLCGQNHASVQVIDGLFTVALAVTPFGELFSVTRCIWKST